MSTNLVLIITNKDNIMQSEKKYEDNAIKKTEGPIRIKAKIMQRLGNNMMYTLIKIESDSEIEEVIFPNEDETYVTVKPINEQKTIAKDLKMALNKEYRVTVNTKEGNTVSKTIIFEADGTQEHPFIIRTVEELQEVEEDLEAYYKIGDNIDLTDYESTPIGTSTSPFSGNIDGEGYTISNLNIEDEENSNIGLFGYNKGTISNITLANVNITGTSNIGGLVGYNVGTVTECTVQGRVTGDSKVGGLIGYISRTGTKGISNLPKLNAYIQITNTYAIGDVTATGIVGGLIGIAGASGYGSTTVANSYWNTETTNQTSSVLGTGRTTEEMLDSANYNGWNFETIWTMFEGEYPKLNY